MKSLIVLVAAAQSLSACAAPGADSPGSPGLAPGATIPEAAIGRWGLVAKDCDPAREDAEGLLTVGAGTLEFDESQARLAAVEARTELVIAGRFDFTGEGETWSRRMLLDVQDDGAVLIRREYGDGAAAGAFTYMACE